MTQTIALPSPAAAELETRSGYRFQVRPAAPGDEDALAAFFAAVAPQDLRFRFLSAVKHVPREELARMAQVDHRRNEHLLAIAPGGEIVATAMLAADPGLDRAEVAMAIRPDLKHKGISWTLLDHVAHCARERGIAMLESIEAADHREAIELEREMGFSANPYPGDATLVLLSKRLSASGR